MKIAARLCGVLISMAWVLNANTVFGNQLQHFQTISNTDYAVAGVGGMRNVGSAEIILGGTSGVIKRAFLYWNGPTNSSDPNANQLIMVNGGAVIGQNIGFSHDNCWGFLNTHSYRADVTSLVIAAGNGTYALTNFLKPNVNINGASLLVFYDDGNNTNNHDVMIFDGNDSNLASAFDSEGFNATFTPIKYSSGLATLQLHVADGQTFQDGALIINSTSLVGDGPIFSGNSVPSANNGPQGDGSLWDIRTFDITNFLTPGDNSLTLTSPLAADCLGLVAAVVTVPTTSQHSNVAFLPGLLGSRLYTNGFLGEDELWIPDHNQDMCQLRPLENGLTATDIYTRDIIEAPFGGTVEVYGEFVQFMNALVTQRYINSWKPLPYDWRLDAGQIVREGVIIGDHGNTVVSQLTASIEDLAQTSQTEKVTIVTHSNGGLVVKELMRELAATGKSNLVDRIIMIAPPQLGTPKAVSSLLHGDDSGLAGGLLLSEHIAREAGETMIGSYNLLPSQEYFNRVASPVIEFDSNSPLTANFINLYGNQIDDYSELRKFLLGDEGARSEPFSGQCLNTPVDTSQPNVLRSALIERVQSLHAFSDSWQPPPDVDVIQVAGWGLATARGISYTSKRRCPLLCGQVLTHRRLDTIDGDGTVVTPSATSIPTSPFVQTFYLNLDTSNRGFFVSDRDHASIMAATPIQDLIHALLDNNTNPSVNHITTSKPSGANWLRLQLRSPVVFDIHDSAGRHTGLKSNEETASAFQVVEKQIPNSSFVRFGDEWYVTLDTRDDYQIELRGLELGTFTLVLEEFVDDNQIASLSYVDIPVSNLTRGNLTVQHVNASIELRLDFQNDGIIDLVVRPNEQASTAVSLAAFRQILSTLGLPSGIEKSLHASLDSAESAFQRGNREAGIRMLNAFVNEVQAQRDKNIPTATAESLISIASTILASS